MEPLHSEETLDEWSLAFWRRRSTSEIIESLAPGAAEPLKVKTNGMIMDGNTRIVVLRERGYDVESLPRQPYQPESGQL